MRVKLDENLPKLLAEHLAGAGHEVETVLGERLGGASYPDLLAACVDDDRMLFTLDRGVGASCCGWRPPPGLIVLRLHDQYAPKVIAAVEELLAAHPWTNGRRHGHCPGRTSKDPPPALSPVARAGP